MNLNSKQKSTPWSMFAKFAFLLAFASLFVSCATGNTKKEFVKAEDGFTLDYQYYPRDPRSKIQRSVIIVPPTGGASTLDRSYAKSMQKKGADVYIMTRWTGQEREDIALNLHQDLHGRAVRAIELLVNQIGPDEKIAVLGTSVGGLFASIAASKVDRIERVFVIGAGLSIPQVIVYSDQKAMKKLKTERYKAFNFQSDEEYLKALEKEFFLDPLTLPKNFENKQLGVLLILDDKTVPTINQRQLVDFWKPDVTIELKAGHFWGIVGAWKHHSKDIEAFLVPEGS